jgi:hypothetical protein
MAPPIDSRQTNLRAPSIGIRRAAANIFLALIVGGAACKSGSTADNDGSIPVLDSGSGAIFDCTAISFLPPLIEVLRSGDGRPLCEAEFAMVGISPDAEAQPSRDAGAVSCAQTDWSGCPTVSDGREPSCTFALVGLIDWRGAGTTYSVQVTSAGYQPKVVTDVRSGLGGCVTPLAPSSHSVRLDPI